MRTSRRLLPEQYRHDSPIGAEVRFNHAECGDTKSRLYVVRTDKGWKHHCHNCAPAMSGYTYDRSPSASRTMERVKQAKEERATAILESEDVVLPPRYTTHLPDSALLWLYHYDITDEEIAQYQIGYDPESDRVILPWFDENGKLLWYQGRALFNSKIKYLTVGRPTFAELFNRNSLGRVTVVEDFLSAIKVSRFTSALCLYGSFMSLPLLKHLGENYVKVNIWLDQDKAKEAFKYAKRLRNTQNMPVSVLMTKHDPKECSDLVIKAQTCYGSEGCATILNKLENKDV